MKDALILEEEMSPIGVIATKYGVTLRALRFYEENGLLNPIRIGAYRLYNKHCEIQLQKILEAKRLGYSIKAIQTKIPLTKWDLSQDVNDEFLRLKLDKLRRDEEKIRNTINKIENLLKSRAK